MDELDLRLEKYRLDLGSWRTVQQQKLREAQDADTNAKLLEQRIAGIMEAKALIDEMKAVSLSEPNVNKQPLTKRRQRSLTGHWQLIMQLVDKFDDFSYDELSNCAEIVGHVVDRDSLRAQMSQYKASGLVESLGKARFRLTGLGREAAGIKPDTGAKASNENGPSHSDPDDRGEGGANSPAPDTNP